MFSQYQGTSGQHIETLLYVSRRYNRAAEFAISTGIGGTNLAGIMLGSLHSISLTNLQSYAAQRTMYENLVSQQSKLYDAKFAQGKGTEFNADAYLALQQRGIKFRDAKAGMAYAISAANDGAVPLLEYNKNLVAGRAAKSTIMKEGEERDYGVLLARFNVSDFASDVKGIVAVKNIASENSPEKWRRVNPSNMVEIESLMEASKLHPYSREGLMQRNNLALIMAGATSEGQTSKPLMRFLSGTDYVNNHVSAFSRGYQKSMSKVGEFTYGVMYPNFENMRGWFAAQARARNALVVISAMTQDVVSGQKRLDANGYMEKNGLSLEDKINGMDVFKTDAEKAKKFKETLGRLVAKMSETDTSANFARRMYARVTTETAEAQSGLYEAKLELRALDRMHKQGLLKANGLDDNAYKDLSSALRQRISAADKNYKEQMKHDAVYRDAVISLTGSHSGTASSTYYGSSRNIFTMSGLMPQFEYKQSFQLEFNMTVESTAMRDSATNRGGQKGGEYWEKMNMNTGQGVYENPRWWASSMYEQATTPYMTLPHIVHRAFLPLASSFYRAQAGLSSFLQRTELETEFGRQKGRLITAPLYFIGLKGGKNDIIGASIQEFSDFSGASSLMSAMRRSGKVFINADGTIESAPAWYSKRLQKLGVESDWVSSDTLLYNQNRIHDRLHASKEWEGNSQIRDANGSLLWKDEKGNFTTVMPSEPSERDSAKAGVRDAVKRWVETYDMYQYAGSAEKAKYEEELKNIEQLIDPFATKYIDQRPDANKRSVGGNYFIKDGSRDRFMEIFMMDHISTWSRIIPGMHEYGPAGFGGGTQFSPEITNYYERAKYGSRMGMLKEFRLHEYDETTQDFVVVNKFDTHRDALREVYRLETPAMMQLLKIQSQTMQYEGLTPIWHGILSTFPFSLGSAWNAEQFWREKYVQEKMKLSEDQHGFMARQLGGLGFGGRALRSELEPDEGANYQMVMQSIRDTISVKRANWDQIAAGVQAGKTGWERTADFLMFRGEAAMERMRLVGLQATEEQRNREEVRRQILLHNM
ncbi:Uncharacterised protein [uncultured archaeon]|nr:Uncharacterised protein [uncultured archaeon]